MNRNIVLRIASPDPVRLWSGSGNLYLPADGIEVDDGALYIGGGELLDGLTDVEQLMNGTAERIDITVSGVTAAAIRLALEEAEGVKGATLDIGTVEFDELWQITGVTWQSQYRVDKLAIGREPDSRTITISMGSDDTGRSRTANAYWTAADQRRRSPDDRFFDFVAGINAGTSRNFGPNG